MDDTASVCRGSLLGLAVGDAMGYAVDAKNLERRIRDAYPNAVARSRRLTAEWKAAKARMKAAEAEWKEARENASQAAFGKLRQSGENWKKRLEEASAKFDAARAELRKKEENAFGRRE